MTRQNIAAVLHAEGTLEETLHQVAPGAEEYDDESQTYPSCDAQGVSRLAIIGEVSHDGSHDDDEDATAYASFPTLARTDAREELVLAKQRTAAIGTRVIGPEEDEHAQRQEHIVMYLTIHCRNLESQDVDEREGEGDVHL